MTYLAKLRLDGRTALVTDGAGGIGAACVDALIEAGASQGATGGQARPVRPDRRDPAG